MQVTKVSKLSGKEHTREVPITEEQMERWKGGMYIQDAAPNLSADDREFLISGSTPEEWDGAFGDEDDA